MNCPYCDGQLVGRQRLCCAAVECRKKRGRAKFLRWQQQLNERVRQVRDGYVPPHRRKDRSPEHA